MPSHITLSIEDVGGKFARLYREGPKLARKLMSDHAVGPTTTLIGNGMRANAAVGPDAPHIRDTVTQNVRGLRGEVGYRKDDFGGDDAGSGGTATIAEVALYNEYDQHPFMRAAAEAQANAFVTRATAALALWEKQL